MIIEKLRAVAGLLILPILLTGCLLAPGKFVSTLTINKDRSFTFTYKGEVVAYDPAGEMSKGMRGLGKSDETKDGEEPSKLADDEKPAEENSDVENERKRAAIAEALSKEAGYRSATYLGKGKFAIDYAISGTLTHNFVYPFNSDAEIMFPFIVVEVRNNNTVRMRAPGYAAETNDKAKTGGLGGGSDDLGKLLDGVFTLDTDGEIVSQNNEDGATKSKGRSVVSWKATPLTKDAPSAVIRFE
jgi:hypothetical protein